MAQRLPPRPQRKHRIRRVEGELANSTKCRTRGSVNEAKRAGAETKGPKGRANQSQVSEKQEVFRRELASSKSLVKEWRAITATLLIRDQSPPSLAQFLLFANSYVIKMALKAPVVAEDLASAPELEPALESLLQSLKVHDSVIESMRANENHRKEDFHGSCSRRREAPQVRSSLRDRSVRSGRLFSPEGNGKAHRSLEAGQGTICWQWTGTR